MLTLIGGGISMNRQISLKKVLLNDYIAFNALLWPIGLLVGYFLYYIFNEGIDNATEVLIIFILIAILAVVVLVWRISIFNSVFNDGLETTATIKNASFFRGRGRINYNYTFLGQEYRGGNAVMRTKLSSGYQPGDQVILLVDRSKPKRAFLRDLYMA